MSSSRTAPTPCGRSPTPQATTLEGTQGAARKEGTRSSLLRRLETPEGPETSWFWLSSRTPSSSPRDPVLKSFSAKLNPGLATICPSAGSGGAPGGPRPSEVRPNGIRRAVYSKDLANPRPAKGEAVLDTRVETPQFHRTKGHAN